MSKAIGIGIAVGALLALCSDASAVDVPVPGGDFEGPEAALWANYWVRNNPTRVYQVGPYDQGMSMKLDMNGSWLRSMKGITQVHAGNTVTIRYMIHIHPASTPDRIGGWYAHSLYLYVANSQDLSGQTRVQQVGGGDRDFTTPGGPGYSNWRENLTPNWEMKTVTWTVAPVDDGKWVGIEFYGSATETDNGVDSVTLDDGRPPSGTVVLVK